VTAGAALHELTVEIAEIVEICCDLFDRRLFFRRQLGLLGGIGAMRQPSHQGNGQNRKQRPEAAARLRQSIQYIWSGHGLVLCVRIVGSRAPA
jgi:hypothetical protein